MLGFFSALSQADELSLFQLIIMSITITQKKIVHAFRAYYAKTLSKSHYILYVAAPFSSPLFSGCRLLLKITFDLSDCFAQHQTGSLFD